MHHRADRAPAVEITLALRGEFNEACDFREEGVVAADADVFASHDLRAALADDDFADRDGSTIRALNAEVFRIRIVQVFSCSGGFCCCHKV